MTFGSNNSFFKLPNLGHFRRSLNVVTSIFTVAKKDLFAYPFQELFNTFLDDIERKPQIKDYFTSHCTP